MSGRPIKHRMPDGTPAIDVARDNGIRVATFHRRIEYGWTVERAATQPVGPYVRYEELLEQVSRVLETDTAR